MKLMDTDGGIVSFGSTHPKWSLIVKVDEQGLVTEVDRKESISDIDYSWILLLEERF